MSVNEQPNPVPEVVFAADQLDVLTMCDREIDEPWCPGSEWFAHRILALLIGEPLPPPPFDDHEEPT